MGIGIKVNLKYNESEREFELSEEMGCPGRIQTTELINRLPAV